MDFYTEKGIKTSDNKDYEANEWDKGHMAPAASLNCNRDMLYATFTYINSSLQHQSLNRGKLKNMISPQSIRKGVTIKFDNVEVDKATIIKASEEWKESHEILFKKQIYGKFN